MAKAWLPWTLALAAGLLLGSALFALPALLSATATTTVIEGACAGGMGGHAEPATAPSRVVNLTLRDNETFEMERPAGPFTMRVTVHNATIATVDSARPPIGRTGWSDGFVAGGCGTEARTERYLARGDGTPTVEYWLDPSA